MLRMFYKMQILPLGLLLFPAALAQQNAVLLPWTPQQFTNTNGTLLVSGKVCSYLAGTSTGTATFTDSTASVQNAIPPNAILLDSTARPTSGGIWLTPNKAYKIVTMTAGSDGTCNTGVVVKTQDNVTLGVASTTNNTFTGTNTFTGPLLTKNIDTNYLYCDQFPGADASLKIQNCIAALPVYSPSASSGQISLVGFDTTATQIWSTNPFKNLIGLNPSVLMWMGATSFQTSVQVKVPQGVQLKGFGRSLAGNANIQAAVGSVWHANVASISSSSNVVSVTTSVGLPSVELNDDIRISGVANSVFNSACTVSSVISSTSFQCTIAGSGTVSSSGGVVDVPMILLGDRSGAASVRLDGVNVDGANIATIGVYSDTVNEQSGIFNAIVSRFTTYSIMMEQSRNPASPQNYFLAGLEVYPTPASTYGIWIFKGGTLHGFDDVTVLNNTGGGAAMTACVTVDGGSGTMISRLHMETCTDGLLLGPNSLVAGLNANALSGPTNATVTNLVHIKPGSYSVDLSNIWGNAGTTNDVLGDDSDIGTINTNTQISHVWIGPGSVGSRTVWNDYVPAGNHATAGLYTFLSGFGSNNRAQWAETANQCGAGAANFDYLCADATGHRLKFNNNNAGTDTVVGAATTDTFTNKTIASPLNGQTTAGQSVAIIPCVTSQRTESALDNNLLTCAIPAQAGSYRIRFMMNVSATNAATIGWTATYTDSNGNAQAPVNLPLVAVGSATWALTASATTDYYGYADIDVNNAGTSIVVKLTFSGTSFTAKCSTTVERII